MYKVLKQEGRAKRGELTTVHGVVQTPVFMNVGTAAAIKGAVAAEDLKTIKTQVELSNTYHLHVRPGDKIVKKLGGLHKFMNWDRPILTDSGGFQVFSLAGLRKIKEEGVYFNSHVDGRKIFMGPEESMQIQSNLASTIAMAFDECPPGTADFSYARKSLDLTHSWMKRCWKRFHETEPKYGYSQTLFPIVQGCVYKDLRQESARFMSDFGAEGYAIGGLAVGEPAEVMYDMIEVVNDILPQDRPRYLMGVGTPVNILEGIERGVDMFDCVMPTRNGRNACLFTAEGIINMRNAKWADCFEPVDPMGHCFADLQYSKAYLHHLFKAKELLAMQIASIHNLAFYLWLVREARRQILADNFAPWKREMVEKLQRKL